MINIPIKKIHADAIIPRRGSKSAAGFDIYAVLKDAVVIHPKETVKIPTGITMAIPEGYFGAIYARSGLAAKEGLRPANCVGVVDSDYRGEVMVALHNDSDFSRVVNGGDRIAQLIIREYPEVQFTETEELPETERGLGGFGSTGSR